MRNVCFLRLGFMRKISEMEKINGDTSISFWPGFKFVILSNDNCVRGWILSHCGVLNERRLICHLYSSARDFFFTTGKSPVERFFFSLKCWCAQGVLRAHLKWIKIYIKKKECFGCHFYYNFQIWISLLLHCQFR